MAKRFIELKVSNIKVKERKTYLSSFFPCPECDGLIGIKVDISKIQADSTTASCKHCGAVISFNWKLKETEY